MAMSIQQALGFFGGATLFYQTYNAVSFFLPWLKPSTLPRYLETADNSPAWAFITGASDGIGKAYAVELASKGFNIVLHGRNLSKLGGVKADLEARYPSRDFRVVVADAKDVTKIDFAAVAEQVSDITLKILINNAGATMPWGHEFDTIENYTLEELSDNVAVNATFPFLLTHALMPQLIKNVPSLIMNMGTQGDVGMPLFPAYGPAKTFLMASTRELALEQAYKKRDIEVLAVRAGHVSNTGTIMAPTSFMMPDGETWVKHALARVGCGQNIIMPYLPHALMDLVLRSLPDWVATPMKIDVIKDLNGKEGMFRKPR